MSSSRRQIAFFVVTFGLLPTSDVRAIDCNGNDVEDAEDLAAASSPDCNGNGIPDECDGIDLAFEAADAELSVTRFPLAILGCDVDGDGDADIVTGNLKPDGSSTVSILRRQGDEFAAAIEFDAGTQLGALVAADFDADGRVDLAATNDSKVALLVGEGTGSFRAPTFFELGESSRDLAAGDVTGDGAVDIVTAHSTVGRVGVLRNEAGAFGAPVWVEVDESPSSIALGDVTADGVADMVVARRAIGRLAVIESRGGGDFAAPIEHDTPLVRPLAVTAVDLDGDGDIDVAAADSGRVAVLINQDGGTLAPPRLVTFPETASSLSAGDFDGDHDHDLLLGFRSAAQTVIIRNMGAESYRPAVELYENIARSSGATPIDFDGDGALDFALLASNAVATFRSIPDSGAPLTFSPPERHLVEGQPHSIAIGDLDRDGDLDVVTGNNSSSNGVTVFMNRGNGTFEPAIKYHITQGHPFSIVLADFDRDGDLDLASGLAPPPGGSCTQCRVLIQPNDGTGFFESGTTYVVGGTAFHVTAGDVDGDGAPEVISSNASTSSVTIMFNDGGGGFERRETFDSRAGPRATTVADVNGDRRADVVVANSGSSSVFMLLNDGDGFREASEPILMPPNYVVASDLDGDARNDLVTASESRGNVTILWNAGSDAGVPRFEAEVIDVHGGPHSLVIADVNGDGQLDLVTSNQPDANVSVLVGTGPRTFTLAGPFTVGIEPRFVVTGDVDLDGDIDIVSQNHGERDIRVLFNQTQIFREDFLSHICTEFDFVNVSIPSSLGRFTKYVVPARGDDGSLIPAVFQNVRRFSLHEDFLAGAFPDQFPTRPQGEEYDQLVGRRATRDYYVGSIARRRGSGGIEYAFTVFADTGSDASEVLSESEVESVYLELKGAFDLELLGYEPDTQLAKEAASSWSDPAFPILTEPTPELEYEAYTLGVGYGRVRVFTLEEFESANSQGLFTFQDIVVVETAPQDVEGVIGGFVTGSIQGPLSHVAVRTARRGTPNAFVLGAVEEFSRFAGELVRLEVGEVTYLVEPASVSEAEEFWRENQPSLPRLAGTDREYGGFDHLLDMDLEGVVNPVSRFGGKATNLARLQRVLTGEYAEFQEAGFGIPMRYYVEFMESNRVAIEGRDLSYQEYLTELLSSEEFKSDSSVRFRVLDEFRDFVRDRGEVSPALVAGLVGRIEEVFGSRALMVRFRSSSNVEDALEFNGAGLYESTSACAADTLDPASPDSSHCDATRDNERTIERALKKVWSSLWTFRAHEERTFFQIPPEAATMGLLVNRAFLDEAANGVAFTGNPQNVRDRRYMITAQVGEESVVSPAAGVSVERNFLEVVEGEVVRIVRDRSSSLVGAGEVVLTEEQLGDLGSLMWHVDTNFPLDLEGYPREQVLLDFEFKVEPDGSLAVKQVRPFLIPETVVPSPAFELLVPEGTVLCGVFSADRTGRDPQVEYELKSEVRLRAGVHELVTSSESFSGELIESVRFGPEQEEAQAVAAGLYRVARVAEGGGVTLYRFSYEQEFTLMGGESYVVQLLGVELRGAGSRALEERFLVDEEFLRFSLVSTGSLAGEPLVSYSSCSDGLLPRWELSLETASGARIDLVERFLPPEGRLLTGPASLQRASVVFGGGESVVVSDYWQLVYSARRHNVDVRYWVVLDPEISVAGLDRAVRVVEVEAPDPVLPGEAPEVAQVRYLDGSYALIAEEAATFYEKGERSESLFQRGDVEADGTLALGDALTLLNYLFRRGAAPSCVKTADVDDDGRVTVSDAVKLLLHLFAGGAAPEPPQNCGVDSSADALSCQYYEVCE